MTTTTAPATQPVGATFLTRERATGLVLTLLGLGIIALFAPATEAAQQSTFVLNLPQYTDVPLLPDLSLPTLWTILLLGTFSAALGVRQIVRSFRNAGGMVGLVILLFALAFLTWAARGKSFNLTGMIASTLLRATPIVLGALSGIWCERSAVINIAIEGMMLGGAFTSVVVSSASGSQMLGLIAGVLTGGILAAVLAVLAIEYKVDQIITGTAINIFAIGLTSFLGASWLAGNEALNTAGTFKPIPIPLLSRIPILGPIFFNINLVIYLMILLVIVTHIVLFYTPWGLRSRAVGEHPKAADTLGVNVFRTRYVNVVIGGLIAGLGGVYFTLGSVGRFDEVMTAGRGFVGLAAMIFGRWNPIGAFAASLVFGFADSLQTKLAILGVPIEPEFLQMAPYIATMIVIAGVVGRAVPPAADGIPYTKE
jgi:simple sugar transport system permease protein